MVSYNILLIIIVFAVILPISASISCLIVSRSYYGLNLVQPSTKFIQCQTIIGNVLKSFPNADIRSSWQNSNTSTSIQYDQSRNAKYVLKSIQTQHHHRITEELTSQGLIITSILKYASLSTTSLWSNVQKYAQRYPQLHIKIFVKQPCN